jgi:hypothetical protein
MNCGDIEYSAIDGRFDGSAGGAGSACAGATVALGASTAPDEPPATLNSSGLLQPTMSYAYPTGV